MVFCRQYLKQEEQAASVDLQWKTIYESLTDHHKVLLSSNG